MSINRFDLIAIGGGPAAQKAAIQASKLGKKAAIIEKDPYLGGGCVHWGTIPSKSLQETSRFYRNLKLSNLHGLQSPQTTKLTLQELMFRAGTVIEKEEDVTREQMIQNRVTTLTGWGKIIDKNQVEVTDSAGRKKSTKQKTFSLLQEVARGVPQMKIFLSKMVLCMTVMGSLR